MGLPLMTDAWIGCVLWASGQKEFRKSFQEKTGFELECLLDRSPIDQLIDKATGHERAAIAGFFDFVTKEIWGEETDERAIEDR